MLQHRTTFVSLAVLVTLSGTIVLSDPLQSVVRQTIYGKVRGYKYSVLENETVERFLGIPYAAPPTGNLRFENPQEPATWADILNVTTVPPACPQLAWVYIEMHVPGFNYNDEDCLYLNIYVPQTSGDDVKKAVFIHIHGGSNEGGMGAMFHGDVLAVLGDVIVVTINYRLGPLGFLSGRDAVFPGNYGLFDQSFALHWVQKNIHFFGGDPTKVTVEGHSAGSADVAFHILSPKSKGVFRYAIMQSGSPTSDWALEHPNGSPRSLMETDAEKLRINCTFNDMLLVKQCLKDADWKTIIKEQHDVFQQWRHNGYYSPVIDNVFIRDTSQSLIENSTLNGEVYMMGITRDEGSEWANFFLSTDWCKELNQDVDMFCIYHQAVDNKQYKQIRNDLIKQEYKPWSDPYNRTAKSIGVSNMMGDRVISAKVIDFASRLSRRNKPTYFYRFEYHSPVSPQPYWLGVPHGRDLFYLFGSPFTGHPLYNYSDEDRAVSHMFIDMWSNFVKTGKPSSSLVAGPIPLFSSNEQLYMKLSGYNGNATLTIGSRPRARQVNLWNNILPKIKRILTGHHDNSRRSENDVTNKTSVGTIGWVFIALSGFLFVLVIVLLACLVHYKRKLQLMI